VLLEGAIERFVMKPLDNSSKSGNYLNKESSESSDGQVCDIVQEDTPDHLVIDSIRNDSVISSHCNVFESEVDGKKNHVVYLVEPIERGQSVELRRRPTWTPIVSGFSNESSVERTWIEKELAEVTCEELLELIDSLCENVAPQLGVVVNAMEKFDSRTSVVSRRRFHWIMTRMCKQLATFAVEDDKCAVKLSAVRGFLWSKPVVDKLLHLAGGNRDIIQQEVREEMLHEFSRNTEMKHFLESRDCWCKVAQDLFKRSIDIFTEYFAVFNNFCPEDEISRRLSQMVSGAIRDITVAAENREDHGASNYRDLSLTMQTKVQTKSSILPRMHHVFLQMYERPYKDALLLCDEPSFELNLNENVHVVAVQETPGTVTWKSAVEASARNDAISLQWYVLNQVAAVVQTVVRCALAMTTPYDSQFQSLKSIESMVLQTVRDALADPTATLVSFDCPNQMIEVINTPEEVAEQCQNRCKYQPNSSPFFLGFIWPVLRASGWRLMAGNYPSDVVYCLPTAYKAGSRVGRLKEKVARQRAHLASESRCVGLGYLSKLTKRLIIKCTQDLESDNISEVDLSPHSQAKGLPVVQVVEAFRSFLWEQLIDKDGDNLGTILRKIEPLFDAICLLFNDLAPHTFYEEENWKLEEGKTWCDVLDCRILMRVLLVVPTLLRDAEMSRAQHDQVACVARELLDFVAREYSQFFGETLHLPTEVYDDEPTVQSILPKRIKSSLGAVAVGSPSEVTHDILSETDSLEIIQKDDRRDLTDFIIAVMDQTIISHATEEDTIRKNRRVSVGHPCIVCRNCHGRHGEGKYFFGSIESMTTAATVIEKHLFRCADLNESVKNEIVATRSKHSDQRKTLPSGAQGAFFARLFARLQSMGPLDDAESGFLVTSTSFVDKLRHHGSETSGSQTARDSSDLDDGFKSHIDVMSFIQSTEPWKSTDSLVEAVEKYYNCLEYGGKIVNTKKSPTNFSSEWLYSKVAP
jgi:hypothetical protein